MAAKADARQARKQADVFKAEAEAARREAELAKSQAEIAKRDLAAATAALASPTEQSTSTRSSIESAASMGETEDVRSRLEKLVCEGGAGRRRSRMSRTSNVDRDTEINQENVGHDGKSIVTITESPAQNGNTNNEDDNTDGDGNNERKPLSEVTNSVTTDEQTPSKTPAPKRTRRLINAPPSE